MPLWRAEEQLLFCPDCLCTSSLPCPFSILGTLTSSSAATKNKCSFTCTYPYVPLCGFFKSTTTLFNLLNLLVTWSAIGHPAEQAVIHTILKRCVNTPIISSLLYQWILCQGSHGQSVTWRTGFLRWFCVGFVVEKLELGQFSLRVIRFSPVSSLSFQQCSSLFLYLSISDAT